MVLSCGVQYASSLMLATATWLGVQGEADLPVIGVLPFRNLSTDAGFDLVADGLTAELISNLTVIDGLQVRSASSAFAFRDASRDVANAGRELNADLILDASVLGSAAEIFSAYIVSGHVTGGNESDMMERSLSEALKLAKRLEEMVQSDSELG